MAQLSCHLHIESLIKKKPSEVLINTILIQLAVLIALRAKLSSQYESALYSLSAVLKVSSFISGIYLAAFCWSNSYKLSCAFLLQDKDPDSEGTFSKKLIPSKPVFSGHLKLVGQPYNQNLEDTDSQEFKELADKLEAIVSQTLDADISVSLLSRTLLFLTVLITVIPSSLIKD